MLNKFKKQAQGEKTSFFMHFFTVFTGIFLIMTVIILQVMRFGIYSSVDASLKDASKNADDYVNLTMSRYFIMMEENSEAPEENQQIKPDGKMAANTDILVYDKDGNTLNYIGAFSGLSDVSFSKKKLNEIIDQTVDNIYGQSEHYHMVTVAVSNDNYPQAAYATIAVNTTQLTESNARYVKIIISVMALFWLISVGASVYLAKWSRKPILESYEKQKAFVENASHELRTPLAVLQNRLESLFRKPDATILDNSENIASSLDEVRNMRILTTNLLNLARRDDGIPVEISDIGPAFFTETFENYQMIAEENQKIIHFDNQIKQPIRSDKALLKQVMTILFDNAIKYTADNGEISLSVESKDRYLLLSVADNGPGIADEDKTKVFDRFYRVDKARTRQSGGFGLGLSLAKQIVDSLKGSIKIANNQPQGSIFQVKIPLAK